MLDPELGDLSKVVRRALVEDLHAGDVTSVATVPPHARAVADLMAKESLRVCGVPVARAVFGAVDESITFDERLADGTDVEAGAVVAVVEGPARSVLAAERTALNFMQRLSGVATQTQAFVAVTQGRCRVTDTRKTTPGLRTLQRYAVRCGGGHNHRNDLGSGILIKENHVRCAGGIASAVTAARGQAPHPLRVQCEVQNAAELREAIEAGVDAVLLDNMSDDEIREAVAIAEHRVFVEASGGVDQERAGRIAALGVDAISVGWITHSARAADLSLLVRVDP